MTQALRPSARLDAAEALGIGHGRFELGLEASPKLIGASADLEAGISLGRATGSMFVQGYGGYSPRIGTVDYGAQAGLRLRW